jgi:hypothetical protein
MPALTPTQVVPVTSAYIDPGAGMNHDHGGAEVLLSSIPGGNTGAGNALGIVARGNFGLYSHYTWQTIAGDGGSNTFSAVTANLEGSLDGTNWFTLDQTTNAAGETRHVAGKPVRYVRAKIVTSTVNAGSPTITVYFAA